MKKKVTVELLKATKIGKTISQINDKKEGFFEDEAIKAVAGNLLKKWKNVHKIHMAQKEKQIEKEKNKDLEKKFLDKNATLPYIPKSKYADLDRLKEGDNIAKKFIKIL